MNRNLVVFTDLDGTLLDHHTYSFSPATEAIGQLNILDIPWILNSSKTLSELLTLRQSLQQQHPLILENGAGVAIPVDYRHRLWSGLNVELSSSQDGFVLHNFGAARDTILQLIQPAKARYRFTGFADMSVPQLCELTGLSETAAGQAMQRNFSEPILWQDSEALLRQFRDDIEALGLSLLQGGRFLHIMGSADKGRAMQWLLSGFHRSDPFPRSVALGDSYNDVAMLEKADIAVIVRSPVHAPPQLASDHEVRITEVEGPAGWNRSVLAILEDNNGG